MNKYLRSVASVALTLGLVFAIGAAASAHGGNPHPGKGTDVGYGHGKGKGKGHTNTVATGTTSCNFHGRLTINSSGAVRITGNITPKHGKACTSTGGTKLKTGHFSTALTSATTTTTTVATTTTTTVAPTTTTTLVGTTTTTVAPTTTTTVACVTTVVPVGALADVSGGTVSWSPRPKVAPSVGVALTGGTVSEVTANGKQYVEIAYTGGSVASGSFAGTSGVTLTAWSNATVAELTSHCSHGSFSISFHGTLTL